MDWDIVPGEIESPCVTFRERRNRDVVRHIARALDWAALDLSSHEISCGTLACVSADLCCRYRCVPVVVNRRRVVLAVEDPWDAALITAHADLLGIPRDRELEFALTTSDGLDVALAKRVSRVKWRAQFPR